MPPPPHPILAPYLTASHRSAAEAYCAGPGRRTTEPTSPGGVKKAKKTRAAYISRLRRAAYMEMLEGACEQADREEDELAARLQAAHEERQALLNSIRALEEEMSEQSSGQRGDYGVADAIAADFGAADVFDVEGAERKSRERNGRNTSGSRSAPLWMDVDLDFGSFMRGTASA